MSATTAPLQNVINGELVAAAEGGTDAVVNPATGEEIAQVASSTQVAVDRAVAAARDAVEGYTQIKRVMAWLSCDVCYDRWEERHTSAASEPPRAGGGSRPTMRPTTELPPAPAVTVGWELPVEAASIHAPAGLHRVSVPLLRLRSDEQLVALFRRGDEDAFQVIHERYRQRLFAYARQMLGGSRSDAEDAMQDVFLRAYGALRADDRPVSLRAWLYRVAHNRCIDQLRRPLPAAVDLFDLTRGPSLHDPLEEAERREDLRRLVADVRRLPDQQRSALLMRELEGLTYQELADALGVSMPAVKSLLVRARIGLVEAIEARDAACGEIRLEIAGAVDRGVRASGRARRHMRECASCREYRSALRGELRQLNGLGGGHGLLGTAAKLLGLGGAGSGAAAGGGAASAGGGAAVIGGSAVATKVAVLACCAAVVGGTVEAQQAAQPAKHPARHAVAPTLPAAATPVVLTSHVQQLAPPRHHRAAVNPATHQAAPVAPPVVKGPTPATDSPVVDQSNGGMLAPDDATSDPTTDPTTTDGSTSGSQGTTSSTAQSSSSSTQAQQAPTDTASGPDGSLTGSVPPTAQGATTPGVTKTPS